MFEEEYKKIIEQLKENEDYAVMRAICENIVDLLEKNGVKPQGTIYKKGGFVVGDNALSNIGTVCFSGLDFTEHDSVLESKFKKIINEQKKQISELESELSVKEELLKIKNRLCGEEPLPFTDEQYEEELIEELEERHQQDCITINQLHTTIDTLVDRYAKLRKMRGL